MASHRQPAEPQAPCPAPLSRHPADGSGGARESARGRARRGRCRRGAAAAAGDRRARADQRRQGAGAGGAGQGAALVLDGHADLAARAGADGAHLTGIEALRRASRRSSRTRIAGCGGLETRHDAMVAAEAGADYVMFGEPDATATGRRSSRSSSASNGGRRCSRFPASALPRIARRDRAAGGGRRRFRRGRRLRLRCRAHGAAARGRRRGATAGDCWRRSA